MIHDPSFYFHASLCQIVKDIFVRRNESKIEQYKNSKTAAELKILIALK